MISNLTSEFESRPIFYQIFILFQLVSLYFWMDDFLYYILFTFMATTSYFYLKKNMDFDSTPMALIVIGIFLYACYSFYEKNPNELYKNNTNVEVRSYVIQDSANKGMLRGTVPGGGVGGLGDYRGWPLDGGNFSGLIVYSKEVNRYVLLSCSLLQKACPYHQNFGDTILVKTTYQTPKYFRAKDYYVYGLMYKGEVINDEYFNSRYKAERLSKMYFILSYLVLNFGLIFYKIFG